MNPASRRGALDESLALKAFTAAGVKCEAVRTERRGHAAQLASELSRNYDALFTLGGDGTAMEVVGALVGSGVPVGVLPGGTGNQIARHLNTPLSIPVAVKALLSGSETSMDLGRLADNRRFALTAGYGMDVEAMARASASAKRRFGVGAYLWTGIGALLRNNQVQVRATVDGVIYERSCGLAMIANVGALMNGFIATGPAVRSDDGILDLCLLSPRSALEAFELTRRSIFRDFRTHPAMLYARGRCIDIEGVPPAAAQADGELLGPVALSAVCEPGAARLLICRQD